MKKKIIKFLILLLILILLVKIISSVFARYQSNATTNSNIQVAFYVPLTHNLKILTKNIKFYVDKGRKASYTAFNDKR